MAGYRNKFTSRDDEEMINFVYQKLRAGEPSADNPCGLRLWELYTKEKNTGHSVSSLTSRFRKYIKGNLATMPMEPFKILYVLKKLRIPIKDEHAQSSLRRRSNCVIVFSCDGNIISFSRRGDAMEKQGPALAQHSLRDRADRPELLLDTPGKVSLMKEKATTSTSSDCLTTSSIASMSEILNVSLGKPLTPSPVRPKTREERRRSKIRHILLDTSFNDPEIPEEMLLSPGKDDEAVEIETTDDEESEGDQSVKREREEEVEEYEDICIDDASSSEGTVASAANEAFVKGGETKREEPSRTLDTHEIVINSQQTSSNGDLLNGLAGGQRRKSEGKRVRFASQVEILHEEECCELEIEDGIDRLDSLLEDTIPEEEQADGAECPSEFDLLDSLLRPTQEGEGSDDLLDSLLRPTQDDDVPGTQLQLIEDSWDKDVVQ